MNLRSIHAVVILFSAALAAVFGFWCLDLYRRQDGTTALVAAVASFTAALGLVAYDSWFLRNTRALR